MFDTVLFVFYTELVIEILQTKGRAVRSSSHEDFNFYKFL